MDADQNLALLWDRSFDLPDLEHVGRTVSVTNQRFHVRFGLQPEVEARCIHEDSVMTPYRCQGH